MITLVPLDQVRFWRVNPNHHPPAQLAALGAAIERFGFVTPITLVRYPGSDGLELRAGEGRVRAMLNRLEDDPTFCPPNLDTPGVIPAVIIDFSSRDEADAYGVADEHIADLAEFDFDQARLILEGLEGFDLSALEALSLDDLVTETETETKKAESGKRAKEITVALHVRVPGGMDVLQAALRRARGQWPGLGTADLLLRVLERFNEA